MDYTTHPQNKNRRDCGNSPAARRTHRHAQKSTDKSISGKQQKSNDNFSVPCVSVIGLYDNTGGMN